jgi:hypothetical protein
VAGWRNDLDWDDLASKLSPSASIIDTSFQDYKEECLPEFLEPRPTAHGLIDQPSGMCLTHGLIGWEMQWPRPSDDGHLSQTFDQLFQDNDGTDASVEQTMGFAFDETNPSLNLPSKVLFPAVASDVVVAVQFAKKNNVEISVKNSGHSYSGSSSKKNTLLLNMNHYVHYAPDGITDCDVDAALLDTTVAKDLSNQACLLSLAKNKSSLIRVGGGENFDKAYRAVIAANKAQEEYKYHLVGGAAGTVSPMGWTWQGGKAGTTGGRLFGMGLDQVLQVEMVLPNGHHVKFGPTEWEDVSADGFIVPRTNVVSGVCRSNPEEQDEEKWIWDDCPEDFGIDFGDLWFAVKGGGGGTWGVVTSVYLQLHEYLPYNTYSLSVVEECSGFTPKFNEFAATYLMAPSLLNVTKEKSLACGDPNEGKLYCFGEEDVTKAWTTFQEMNNLTEAQPCLVNEGAMNEELSGGLTEAPKSFQEDERFGEEARFPGKVMDYPHPGPIDIWFGFVLVPQSWLDESEENMKILLEFTAPDVPYYAIGFATASLSDQANSLSKAHRDAATMVPFNFDDEANFWSNLFPKMFDISDKTKFPPVFGSNHAGPLLTGPLKEDWTKLCPREWTFEERKEKCISSQEAIYGTELLSRLEAIKKAVDPQFIFNCNSCIGNNLAKASHSQDDELTSPTTATQPEEEEPSGASYASTYTTVISAIALHLFLSIVN